MFNPRFNVEYGYHNGSHSQSYYGFSTGVNIKPDEASIHRFYLGAGIDEGNIQKRFLDEDSFIGYKYHGKYITLGYERSFHNGWSLGFHESLIVADYFVGIGSTRDPGTLLGNDKDDHFYLGKSELIAVYKYVGMGVSLATDLSVGGKILVQIGR